jgi:hypothetical protein
LTLVVWAATMKAIQFLASTFPLPAVDGRRHKVARPAQEWTSDEDRPDATSFERRTPRSAG